ncbi:MAG: AbrB/MazE/SpoVT family DNA-binding domain-containing protein [Kineosporiaceae bacterium]
MRVTVDRVGRVVIPKSLRTALGIGPDTELEVMPDGGGLRLDPVRPIDRAVVETDGFPLLAPVTGAVITDADVARLRDELQR